MQFTAQFTAIFATALFAGSAIASPLVAEIAARQDQPFPSGDNNCYSKNNCCYPSPAACTRQFGSINNYFTEYCDPNNTERNPSPDGLVNVEFCDALGVDVSKCGDADCCRVDTGTGRNCPPKTVS